MHNIIEKKLKREEQDGMREVKCCLKQNIPWLQPSKLVPHRH